MTSDDKFAEVYFKEMLTLDEQVEYARWIDMLVEHGQVGMDELTDDEVDQKMYRMYQADLNQQTRKDIL
jgi:hypothetical protein